MRPLLPALMLLVPLMASAAEHDVVILRPNKYLADNPRTASEVTGYFNTARNILAAAGLRHHTIDEAEAVDGGIPADEFLLCPYNPSMPPEVIAAVGRFLDVGGHGLFCFLLEEPLRSRIGIGEGDYTPAGEGKLFAALHATGDAPEGMPQQVRQESWNAFLLRSVDPGKARVAMEWLAADGQTNSGAALVMSHEAAWLGHILTGGDLIGKAQMLLAIVGHWRPAVWEQGVQAALDPDLGFRHAATLEDLRKLSQGGAAEAGVSQMVTDLEALKQQVGRAPAWEIIRKGRELRAQAESLYLGSLPTRADAMRGAWVVGVNGCGDWGWDKTARVARDNGLTDLFVRIAWAGRASYPSEVLHSRLEGDEDPVAAGIAACHRYGLRYHAWFINLNWRTPPQELIDQYGAKGLWQFGPDGKPGIMEGGDRVYWLNPSEPEVVALQAAMMAEVAGNYAVDGVHFDYIRYENYNGSYGERDRQRFERWAQVEVEDWPGDVLPRKGETPEGPLHGKFCEWRCEQVSDVVQAVHSAVRAARPDCEISAAVYPSWPYHRKIVGQDWAWWLKEGWIDFVCPMVYDAPGYYDRHIDRVARLRAAAGDKPFMAGLGSWLHPSARTVAEAIVADRELGADGFLLFSYTPELGNDILPELRRTVFRGQ